MNVSNWISLVSVVLAAFGGFFTLFQWYKKIKLKRSEYILNILEKIRNDKKISNVIYMIEYSEKWYGYDFHNDKNLEPQVDYTLSFFSYICYLKNKNLISKYEFKFLEYEVTRIVTNPQVQNYLYNVYHFSKHVKTEFCFSYLKEYAEKQNLLLEGFEDDDSYSKYKYFKKYLNW